MLLDNAIYSSDLSSAEKERFGELIETIYKDMPNKTEISAVKGTYEFISRQKALLSRAILPDLENDYRILLRLYGRFGLSINRTLRDINYKPPTSASKRLQRSISDNYFNRFKKGTTINSADDVDTVDPELVGENFFPSKLLGIGRAVSIRNKISDLIEEHHERFDKSGYAYRISRAKKHVYAPGSPAVSPDDLIMDDAFWSTTSDHRTAIYRYSAQTEDKDEKRKPASNPTPIASDEEEILYVIEKNQAFKGIDISGYKFRREKEKYSSGEMLVNSRACFRVVAIQKDEHIMPRRIVVLRPEELPVSPIVGGAGSNMGSTVTVSAGDTGGAVEGAVGGAGGDRIAIRGAVGGRDIVKNPFDGTIVTNI